MRGMMAAVTAALLVAAPAGATVKLGVEKWQAGDFKGAVTQWLPFAAQGDPDALFNMGQAYKLGRGVARDDKIAIDYFRKAAAKDHEAAQEQLGLALYANRVTRPEAMQWLEIAARADQPRAQYVLGVAYFNGDDVQKNWPLAYGLMLRSNAKGMSQAGTALATMNASVSMTDRQEGEKIAQSLADGNGIPGSPPPPPPQPTAIASAQPGAQPVAAAPTPTKSASVASAPRPATPVSGGWRVQLGAFSGQRAAADGWTRLSKAQPSILGDQTPIYVQAGAVTRLQVGPFATREAARALCGRLMAAGKTCFVAPGS